MGSVEIKEILSEVLISFEELALLAQKIKTKLNSL
jgi:hypothetical protein